MSDDQFTKLFIYMQKEFAEVNKKLDDKASKGQLDTVYNLLDAFMKKSETDEQERFFANHQIDRHEGWIKQLAASTKTKLVPEP